MKTVPVWSEEERESAGSGVKTREELHHVSESRSSACSSFRSAEVTTAANDHVASVGDVIKTNVTDITSSLDLLIFN